MVIVIKCVLQSIVVFKVLKSHGGIKTRILFIFRITVIIVDRLILKQYFRITAGGRIVYRIIYDHLEGLRGSCPSMSAILPFDYKTVIIGIVILENTVIAGILEVVPEWSD